MYILWENIPVLQLCVWKYRIFYENKRTLRKAMYLFYFSFPRHYNKMYNKNKMYKNGSNRIGSALNGFG